ncbi:hypothetical protein TWF281_011017 [Arthrobotrys megalospora]
MFLRVLKRKMCRESWLIYRVNRIRGKQYEWEERDSREREYLSRQSLAPGANSFPTKVPPEVPFPFAEVALKYQISEECPAFLAKELYRIQETARYFTNRFRSSKFNVNEQRRYLPLPSLLDLSEEELDRVFYEFWLTSMLFGKGLCRTWHWGLRGNDTAWYSDCEAIFGDQNNYDRAQQDRIQTVQNFLQKVAGDLLTACHEYAQSLFVEPRLPNMGPPYIRARLDCIPCPKDEGNWPRYVYEFVIRYNLPGIQWFLDAGTQKSYHALKPETEAIWTLRGRMEGVENGII